jgi:hypothetical protein
MTSGIVSLVTARLEAAGLTVPDVWVTAEDVVAGTANTCHQQRS